MLYPAVLKLVFSNILYVCLQVWELGPRPIIEAVTLKQLGHFLSDNVYLIQHSYQGRPSSAAGLEHVAFVWVGADVGRGKSGGVAVGGVHVQQAIRHLKRLSSATARDMVRKYGIWYI